MIYEYLRVESFKNQIDFLYFLSSIKLKKMKFYRRRDDVFITLSKKITKIVDIFIKRMYTKYIF